MIGKKARQSLSEGEALTGHFRAGASDLEIPGVLTWSPTDGAVLELIGATSDWPAIGSPPFTVRGWLRDGGEVTLLRAWAKSMALGEHITRARASTLVLGEHVEPEERWPRAIYGTANLSEWRRDSGLVFSPRSRGPEPDRISVDWQPPARDEVEIDGARLTFFGRRDTTFAYAADWTIETSQCLSVEPTGPVTIGEGWRKFATPLLNLLSLASDRPDSVVREVLVDAERERRIEVWRAGQTVRPREWNPVRGFIFHADDLADYAASIKRWWILDEQLRPALGLFGDHVNQGSTYSPSRFLTLFTAMEVYARERHGRKDFRLLRRFAGVREEVTGCTDTALALIGASRQYFAHLGSTPSGPTPEEIEAELLTTIRRASALMQACLLRELGFSAAETEGMLSRHYANWPLT
jgi:ApeA N-terminal domain 1